jgi:uncharacterized protein with von Willebrand factor type A (vWA) domain
VDFLLLLDVSGSMRPQVQRLASAAHSALRVLGRDDRVAIMVFDRSTRVRMKFRSGEGNVERELEESPWSGALQWRHRQHHARPV